MKKNTLKIGNVYSEKTLNTIEQRETQIINLKTNKMKYLVILPIILLLILSSSCTKDSIIESGEITSELRSVTSFTKLSSEGIFEVTITQGNTQSVEIIAHENIFPYIKSMVVNNELRLYLDDDYNYGNVTLMANITVPNIYSVRNSGAGNISILNIDNDENFNVENSGSGEISIEGTAQGLSIRNEGSGNFNGFLFTVPNCSINTIGSGDSKVNCTGNLNIRIEGSGDVYFLGTPIIAADISGSGEVVNAN